MTVQHVNTPPTRAPDPSQRPGSAAPSGRPGAAEAFSRALANSRQELTETTVRAGDTLVGIVRRHLQASGTPVRLNGDQTFRLALGVARDNALSNPDLILPGQVLDLSSLESRAMAEAVRAPAAPAATAQARLPAAATPAASAPPGPEGSVAAASPSATPAASRGAAGGAMAVPAAFLIRHAEAANKAQSASGIPATFMLSQAALETGWGRQEIRMADGRTSFNLFGIRAGPGWPGKTAEVWTTEFINGAPQRVRGRFRAYDSYEESFADYARLISQNPRYAAAMRNVQDPAAFSAAIQNAGYATAPDYGATLASVIQTTLRLQNTLGESLMARRPMPGVQLVAQPLPTPASAQPAMPGAAQVLGMRASAGAPLPAAAPAPGAAPALPGAAAATTPAVAPAAVPATPPAAIVRPPRLRPYAMLDQPPAIP